MMKQYSLFLFLGIVFFSFCAQAQRTQGTYKNAKGLNSTQNTPNSRPYEKYDTCAVYKEPIEVELLIDLGKPVYNNSLSGMEFPAKPYSTTMGLTTARLKTEIQASNFIQQINSTTVCLGLKKLRVTLSFPEINVYIDKKYRPGSCQYRVIREHENYHVRVHQEGLKFFSKKIKEGFVAAANKLLPIQISSPEEGEKAFQAMIQDIQKDVSPLLNYVENRIKEENLVIDTQTSYENEAKKCPAW